MDDSTDNRIYPLSLSLGGETWNGWTFGPWGRARDWRLHAPNGEHYTADELLLTRRRDHDLNYLQQRINIIEDAAAIYIPRADAAILREAASILAALIPRAQRIHKK